MLLEVAFARTPKEKRYVVVLVSSKYFIISAKLGVGIKLHCFNSSTSVNWQERVYIPYTLSCQYYSGKKSAGVHSFFPVLVRFGRAIVWGYTLSFQY